jgi:L-2,4-diaminobutyrate transaminase
MPAGPIVEPISEEAALAARDRLSVLHPFTRVDDYAAGRGNAPFIVKSGRGIMISDEQGREVIDGFSGLYCVNVGYGQDRIVNAMMRQARELPFFHSFAGATNRPAIELADKLLEIAGPKMKRVFFGLSGSDANETQVKLVWYTNNVRGLPLKKKIIARDRGYHGGTIVSGSLTGLAAYHQGFDQLVDGIKHTTAPDPFWAEEADPAAFAQRCARDLEALILAEGPETVGAFIAEPVIGAGGIVPPPPGYWAAIQEVLRRYDVLLILDEVVTGFGRCGAMLAYPAMGIEPDLVTTAKGLTSAYAPLSAVLVGERVWSALQAGTAKHGLFGHGYTYTAHPMCAAAALANIAIIEDDGLCRNATDMGGYLLEALNSRLGACPLVGEIRGFGLLAAVEFVAEGSPRRRLPTDLKLASRINALCFEEGLLARAMPFGDIVGLAPPLILDRAGADAIVARLGRAVDRAIAELTAAQRTAA